jgi:hypothetical protein
MKKWIDLKNPLTLAYALEVCLDLTFVALAVPRGPRVLIPTVMRLGVMLTLGALSFRYNWARACFGGLLGFSALGMFTFGFMSLKGGAHFEPSGMPLFMGLVFAVQSACALAPPWGNSARISAS